MTTDETASPRRLTQGGPHLGALAIVVAGLFLLGLVLSTVLAHGRPYPSPFGAEAGVLEYFRDYPTAVRLGGALQFAAAIPLAIYAATVSARLHQLGIRAPGATIALAGGLLAAAFLALSGLLGWTLSRPELHDDPALVRALQLLNFAAGGAGHVVFLGLLLAGIAVPALLARLLPAWLAWAGLVIAGIAELSTLALLIDLAAYLLPIARFAGLAWLIAAGFLLPRQRARANA
jgi:hypothetical protein